MRNQYAINSEGGQTTHGDNENGNDNNENLGEYWTMA